MPKSNLPFCAFAQNFYFKINSDFSELLRIIIIYIPRVPKGHPRAEDFTSRCECWAEWGYVELVCLLLTSCHIILQGAIITKYHKKKLHNYKGG